MPGGLLSGGCEASAIVPWKGGWLVGDNEVGDELFTYDAAFAPVARVPLGVDVDDIEAVAVKDGGVWVIASHSAEKDGDRTSARERILTLDGEVLVLDLSTCQGCEAIAGVSLAEGDVNIEGAAWRADKLWLGLRAPLTDAGNALLLVVDSEGRVERAAELHLGGLGVRDLVPEGEGLLIVAGPSGDDEAAHALWRLPTTDGEATRLPVELPPSTEGAALDPADPSALVYVTDGAGKAGDCKRPAYWGRVRLPR